MVPRISSGIGRSHFIDRSSTLDPIDSACRGCEDFLKSRILGTSPMSEFHVSSPIAIRGDLAAAHDRAWERIGRPGTWWDGAARVAIAAETRHASSCRLCRRRKEALSPAAIEGTHDSLGALSEVVVEVVHRVRTDPGRLSERWFRGVIAAGLSEEQYVETISIVAHLVAIDTMAGGLGCNLPLLPQPEQ